MILKALNSFIQEACALVREADLHDIGDALRLEALPHNIEVLGAHA